MEKKFWDATATHSKCHWSQHSTTMPQPAPQPPPKISTIHYLQENLSLMPVSFKVPSNPIHSMILWGKVCHCSPGYAQISKITKCSTNTTTAREFNPSPDSLGLFWTPKSAFKVQLQMSRVEDKETSISKKQLKMIHLGWTTLPAEQTTQVLPGNQTDKCARFIRQGILAPRSSHGKERFGLPKWNSWIDQTAWEGAK